MISIARYDAQVGRALRLGIGLTGRVVAPLGQHIAWPPARAVVRYAIYPAQVLALLRQGRSDTLLHVTHESYAHLLPAHRPSIITCHDLGLFFFTDLSRAQQTRWKSKLNYIHRARRVIADSMSTCRDLQALLHVAPEKIVVNHLGVDADFRRLDTDHSYSLLGARVRALAEQYPLALHVGTNLSRKNMHTLLGAVAAVRARGWPLRLVKVGSRLMKSVYGPLIRELGLGDAIEDLGFLNIDEMVEVYNLCRVFLFPSLYEGFGFPVLEAQACGLPCVISNATSLPEVSGTAALYHEPKDTTALADGIARVLTDAVERARLVAAGYANARRFTWEAHGRRLLDVYVEVAKAHGRA